jgi:DNA repair exonuclease SbcCD ATPase subunit
MKRVSFEKVVARNFMSIGEEPIELNYRHGVNIITGANLDREESGNGVGKSSVVEILYFALFGTTIRDVKATQIKHYSATDPAEVTVDFTVKDTSGTSKYELIRNASPSRVSLYKQGVDITPSTIPKTNDLIKQIIGATPEVFQNSIIMTVNGAIPFMSQRKVDKRKFLEGILGLGAFGEMLLMARLDFNNTKSDYQVEYGKYSTSIKSLENIEGMLKSYKLQKKEKLENYKSRIENNKDRIIKLEEETKKLKDELQGYKSSDEIKIIENQIHKLEEENADHVKENTIMLHKKGLLEREIKEQENIPDVCPACQRKLTKTLLEEANKKISKAKKSILNIDKEIIKKEKTILEIKEQIKENRKEREVFLHETQSIKYKLQSCKTNSSSIKEYKENIKSLEEDIKDLDKDEDRYTDSIKKLQIEVCEMQNIVQDLDKKMEIYKISKFIVSEEGIRSFVVKKILKLLNSRLSYYLNVLDAPCTCEFDQYFVEKLVNEKGHECSYHNFSAGERKRIDLAILFTFQDLRRLQSDSSINVSIYDELLDSSLDKQGIKNVMKILDERVDKYNECVYIVTHRPDAVDTISGEIIFLEKENGVTKISQ